MTVARLHQEYREKIIKSVQEKFQVSNGMAVPRLLKVVINMGVGEAIGDAKILEAAVKDLAKISGQQPTITRSRKAISNFKLREDIPIGCKVTLRGSRMYEFCDRFFNVTLPRIRDFNGVSFKSFDAQGNYTVGISDQSIFPEINLGRLQYTQGMDITFVFNHGPQEQTREVLTQLGMPFRKKTN
ncbi:MAG: 50S ribosomal protein L5 [Candidatus Moranbacteria bacterium]|nr:50S ribosomal protein L5 [Candidatus Moranbacteria bacterium]